MLPNDDETPLEETSDKDPEVVVPDDCRKQNMQKKWYDFEHEALGGKKVIENPSDRSLTHLMMCKFCLGWKKMRPWDPRHFIDHVNFHCRKYQQHLQAQQKRSASHGMHRFFGSKPTENPEKEEAKAEHQGSSTKIDDHGNSHRAEIVPCRGVPTFLFAADIDEPLKSQCSTLFGEDWPRQLLQTSVMTWFEVVTYAAGASLRFDEPGDSSIPTIFSNTCNAGKKLANSGKPWSPTDTMEEVSDILREKVPAEFQPILGKSWPQCSQCRKLNPMVSKVRKPNSKLVAAKFITHHINTADTQHIRYLNAVKHSSASATGGCSHWKPDAFN